MDAVRDHASSRTAHLTALGAPRAIGLDETSFLAATASSPTIFVTHVVNLDTGATIDVLLGRSKQAVDAWLASKPQVWRDGIDHVVIDPHQPYAAAVREWLPDARIVVDHFHIIRLANQALDEVRRRVQQDTLGHRGHRDDPLYRIRRRLLCAHENLTVKGFDRVLAWLEHGDPDGEVSTAYLANYPALGGGSREVSAGRSWLEPSEVAFEAGDDTFVAGGLGGPAAVRRRRRGGGGCRRVGRVMAGTNSGAVT